MQTIIRASSLTNWLDCQRRAATQIFEGDIINAGYTLRNIRNNIGAAVGTGVHAGSMWSAQLKMEGKAENKTESEHRSLEAFAAEMEKGVGFDQVTNDRNTAEKQIIRQVASFRSHILPSVMPSSVETRLKAEYDEFMILTGQPDIIQDNSGFETVRDLKAGKMSGYHGAQVGGYSLLARAHGQNIKNVIIDHVPRVDIRKDQPLPTSTAYDIGSCEVLARSVIASIEHSHDVFTQKGYDIEAFLPNPSSMLCSDKFCKAYGTKACPHHKKGK